MFGSCFRTLAVISVSDFCQSSCKGSLVCCLQIYAYLIFCDSVQTSLHLSAFICQDYQQTSTAWHLQLCTHTLLRFPWTHLIPHHLALSDATPHPSPLSSVWCHISSLTTELSLIPPQTCHQLWVNPLLVYFSLFSLTPWVLLASSSDSPSTINLSKSILSHGSLILSSVRRGHVSDAVFFTWNSTHVSVLRYRLCWKQIKKQTLNICEWSKPLCILKLGFHLYTYGKNYYTTRSSSSPPKQQQTNKNTQAKQNKNNNKCNINTTTKQTKKPMTLYIAISMKHTTCIHVCKIRHSIFMTAKYVTTLHLWSPSWTHMDCQNLMLQTLPCSWLKCVLVAGHIWTVKNWYCKCFHIPDWSASW